MKNKLEGIKTRLYITGYTNKEQIKNDMGILLEMISRCNNKNLKQEMCNVYNELFMKEGK